MPLSRRLLLKFLSPLALSTLLFQKKSISENLTDINIKNFKSNDHESVESDEKLRSGYVISNDKEASSSNLQVSKLSNQFQTTVSPLDFGAKSNDILYDNTNHVIAAIQYAASENLALDLRCGPWRIKKHLDFTLIHQIISDWSGRFIIDSLDFEPSKSGFTIEIGNFNGGFRHNRANYTSILGQLALFCENRSKELNGIFIKGSLLSIDSLRVVNFNGTGILISSTWDSTIRSLSAELCGNVNKFQISIESGGDTSNCLFISRIQSERAFHKCLSIKCIRSVINTIHAERTMVLTEDDGTKNLPSGLNYCNFIIEVGNTTINQIIHDVVQNPKLNKKKNKIGLGSSVVLNLDYSSLHDAAFADSFISTKYSRNSSFNTIMCKCWIVSQNSKNITANNVNILEWFSSYGQVIVTNGFCEKINLTGMENNLAISHVDINSVSCAIKDSDVTFNNCRFPESFVFTQPAATSKVTQIFSERKFITFNNCQVLGKIIGGFNRHAVFKGGYLNQVELADSSYLSFDGVKMNEFDFKGQASFTSINCQSNKVHKWSLPMDDSILDGTYTERMGSGDGFRYRLNHGKWSKAE